MHTYIHTFFSFILMSDSQRRKFFNFMQRQTIQILRKDGRDGRREGREGEGGGGRREGGRREGYVHFLLKG